MKRNVQIVRTIEEWNSLQIDVSKAHVADVETKGTDPKNGKLLGLAIAPLEGTFPNGVEAVYVVVQEYLYTRSEWRSSFSDELYAAVQKFISLSALLGHNFCFDRGWLDHFFDSQTTWAACTRIMWHMSSAPAKVDGYALKDAQVRVLGWSERGDVELSEQIKARGGDPGPDKYLSDTDVLGYYAGLDAISTKELYFKTKEHFDRHDQWALLDDMMRFTMLLDRNTRRGILTDVPKLEKAAADLKAGMEESRAELKHLLSGYIAKLEEEWKETELAGYSDTPAGRTARQKFLSNPSRWKQFNPGSDPNKKELFYETMGLPVVKKVKPRKNPKTGRREYSNNPSTTFEAISLSIIQSQRQELMPVLDAYEKAEHFETMHNNFASKWLKQIRGGRIHPSFDTSRTVSYRTAGRDPNFMAPPFEEESLMSCFGCDPGRGGVHADLTAVEPTLTCHYSQDPNLLKVFRDGLGDVYLDLALTLFPYDRELRELYDPLVPCSSFVKERLKTPRKKSKIAQLAIQYTGTEYAISTALRCTLEEGVEIYENYWRHYAAVDRCNRRLIKLHDQRGYLINAAGRVIQMPWVGHKDTPNRFFQSGGHDILIFWALEIDRLCKERGIDGEPILGDCHDSSSWTAPIEQVPALREVFVDALAEVNNRVRLTVPIKAEIKEFRTLSGLKLEELNLQEAA